MPAGAMALEWWSRMDGQKDAEARRRQSAAELTRLGDFFPAAVKSLASELLRTEKGGRDVGALRKLVLEVDEGILEKVTDIDVARDQF